MIERKVTHFLIIKDEEQDESWCKCWNNESSSMQYDALIVEDDVKLSSLYNHAFLRSSIYICEHAQWRHNMCKSLLCSNDEHNNSIRSFDHYDLSCINIYWNTQK